jgi:hypothetical protein
MKRSFDEENAMTYGSGSSSTPDMPSGGWRALRRRRVLLSAGAAAGMLAATVAVVTVGGAPSAHAKVTAAAAHSAGKSFHVHISAQSESVLDGAFDPARRVGRVSYSGGEILYLGDTTYMRSTGPEHLPLPPGKRWLSAPGPIEASIEAFNPQYGLDRLRSVTNVREAGAASGPGWTGRRYSFTDPGEGNAGSLLAVDSHGLVRVLEFNFNEPHGGGPGHVVEEFGDYGARVDVTAPPADEVIASDKLQPKMPKASKRPGR